MSDYGVSSTGFKRKRLNLLLEELNSEVKSIFGENFNVSPESPDGQINGVISESNANLWEIAEEAYNAFNPKAAAGTTLSNLVQLNGITRLAATRSHVELTLTGDSGTVIPEGSLISTSDTGDELSTDVSVTIDGTGNAIVQATALEFGPITMLAGTITEIDNPVTGWDTVNNTVDAIEGTNEESDPDLRARRQRSVARDAQAIIDGIRAAVENIDNVTQAVVLENDTDAVDGNGLPAHSFQVVVSGGADIDVADIIWLKKPAGIQAFGDITEQIIDSQGVSHDISFSRPTAVTIYVEVTITTFAEYSANGDDLIKQAIVDYANGDLVDNRSFGLADDVIYTRLYTPINSVAGHEIDDLQISISSPASGTANIAIAVDEIADFQIANITVVS
jgi:uncharacterized phage protein gp47/JayE